MEPIQEPKLLKISDAAKIFAVNTSTVWRWIEKGYIKSIKYPSGSHRISQEEIYNFLNNLHLKKDTFRVMIIDDDEEAVDMMREMLEISDLSLEISTNTDGLDALVEIGKNRPDAIIIDYQLRDIDGITISNRIKQNKELKNIPIILISGVIEKVPYEEMGFYAFLRKPFLPVDITNTLKSCFAAA